MLVVCAKHGEHGDLEVAVGGRTAPLASRGSFSVGIAKPRISQYPLHHGDRTEVSGELWPCRSDEFIMTHFKYLAEKCHVGFIINLLINIAFF